MLAALPASFPQPVPRPAPCPERLGRIRSAGQKLRLYPVDPQEPLVEVMTRIGWALSRRLNIYQPDAQEVSFDEAWLLNLLDARAAGDHDRYCFALYSRMSRAAAAELHLSLLQTANRLD